MRVEREKKKNAKSGNKFPRHVTVGFPGTSPWQRSGLLRKYATLCRQHAIASVFSRVICVVLFLGTLLLATDVWGLFLLFYIKIIDVI